MVVHFAIYPRGEVLFSVLLGQDETTNIAIYLYINIPFLYIYIKKNINLYNNI